MHNSSAPDFVYRLKDSQSTPRIDALLYAFRGPAVVPELSQLSPLLQENLACLMLRLLQFVYPIAPNLFQQTTVLIVHTLLGEEI